MALSTLKSREAFLRVRGGRRCQNVAFVLEAKKRAANTRATLAQTSQDAGDLPRFGFIITKKLGNAVVRNRIRRRLKHALYDLAPGNTKPDFDYVVIARQRAATQPFANLKKDLERCLQRVHDPRSAPRRSPQRGRSA